MSPVKTIVRSLTCVFAFAIVLGSASAAFGDSRDINNPTVITSFPVTGNLGSGTFYYRIPEAMVSAGRANVVLDMHSPDGGASMTVTLSGRRCCPPEAYLGITTGLSDRLREATSFEVPGQQDLLVTVYISVGAKQTVFYRINFNLGAPTSGIVVTPPPRRTGPPATPAIPTPDRICTDLGVDFYTVTNLRGRTKKVSGVVRNYTTTHPYKGYERGQWLQVFDVTDAPRGEPVRLLQVRIPRHMDPGAVFSYGVVHTPTTDRRRYQVKIVYGAWLGTDRSEYNDDCNNANDATERQMIGGFPVEDGKVVLEPVPRP